ncbi:MAG: glycosyltransferase [Flavobacteriales bacterium]|nr:glycosyltransferase [Flavobacteriales bacterium]
MSTSPLVSVIMPAYNAAPYIEEAIRSVLTQTLGDLELIVVNDGSTDGTGAVARTIADPRVRVIDQPNGGVSRARNTGIDGARGTYIALLDADDTMLPENLRTKTTALEAAGADWVFGDVWRCDAEMRPLGDPEQGTDGDVVRTTLMGRGTAVPGISSNLLVHRRCFDGGIRFDPQLSNAADQDMVLALGRAHKWTRVPVALSKYRTLSTSMSRNVALYQKDHLYLFAKAAASGLLDDAAFRRRCLANAYWAIGGSWWKNAGSPAKAVPWLFRAVLMRPALVLRPVLGRP